MILNVSNLEDLNKKGVYKIRNIVNNKVYIGSTSVSFKGRLCNHFGQLRKNKHPNSYLQSSYNKYGEENFEISILYIGNVEDEIRDKEQYYITTLETCNPSIGYNLDSDVYRKYRDETVNKKISETLKRKYKSGEIIPSTHRNAFKGRKRVEHGIKMRGKKHAVLISDRNGRPIVTFRGQLDIQEYTTNNIIPGTVLSPHSTKGYYISKKMVAKYIDTQKTYKGLLFKKVKPLSSEMGIAKWENCWNGENPNQQPSISLTTNEGSETNS